MANRKLCLVLERFGTVAIKFIRPVKPTHYNIYSPGLIEQLTKNFGHQDRWRTMPWMGTGLGPNLLDKGTVV